MDQNIPIDIHTNKLLDWLISRRHVNKEWQTYILPIREKINNAIKDMPVHEGIVRLLSGSYINYFHCRKIIDILKETEKSSKNFFGSYTSQRMKDWQEVVKLYEKDNVYLAEAAQMLIRNVAYEVPSLKRQIAKCDQLQVECDKKEVDYGKNANRVKGEFQNLCKQLGIPGKNIKRELSERLSELPQMYNKIAERVKCLDKAVEFYVEFVKFVLGREHDGGCVPVLKFILEHGNTTTYEWIYGEPPLKIEEPLPDIDLTEGENGNSNDNEIDFGEGSGIDFGDSNANNIDFGESNVESSGGIDWGNIDNAELVEVNPDEIDFNISLEESGIVVESTGLEGGVAKGNEVYTLLDNPKTRDSFIDDLMEVQAFLRVRLLEMSAPSNLLSLYQLQSAPTMVQLQSIESVTQMLDFVQDVISQITNTNLQHLHNIKHSARYVDTLANSLKHKLDIVEKMKASQEAVKSRKKDIIVEASSLQPKLKLIIDKTKELQREIEEDISKKYKGRPVNIMGGINML